MNSNKTWKILGLVVLVGFIGGAIIFYKTWYQPHRDVTKETAVTLTAQAIADTYANNEKQADSLYLDKAIEVTGEVQEIKETQEGKTVLSFKTDDPMAGVRCTMKETPQVEKGQTVTVRGICSGYLMDVTLIECYLVK